MTSPSVRKGKQRTNPSRGRGKLTTLPLLGRRCAAWAVEITLVVASGVIPLGIGIYTNSTGDQERVPLNPVLGITESTLTRTLALPVSYNNRNVVPLTNLFWSLALAAPLGLTAWQFYVLSKTGATIPKRLLGVRVVTATLKPPTIQQILLREGVGRWGLPLSVAYFIWRYTGAFPNLGILSGLAGLMLVGEGMVYLLRQEQRTLHDRIAGTYTIDATRPYTPFAEPSKQPADVVEQFNEAEEDAAIASVIITPESMRGPAIWRWMRLNPGFTLLLVGLFSMAAVLGTLVSTQVYVQTQANSRGEQQRNREQFMALVKRLDSKSNASEQERRAAILALGTLNEPQGIRFLVQLLGQESNPNLLDAIQQALVSTGAKSLPELSKLNQSLANELESVRQGGDKATEVTKLRRLQSSQQAIAKILAVSSGKNADVNLSRVFLSQNLSQDKPPFMLLLDKIDLSGVNFQSANLTNGSFRGSKFRGLGEDNRLDTDDDWIADLSQARMHQANLTDANLSRVSLNRTDLSRAALNRADLSNAHLSGANLSNAQMIGANMREAVLQNARIISADLGEANLREANLFGANLSRAIALGAQFISANLTRTNWQGADLSGTDFTRANLRYANLSATKLTGAIFRFTQMENVNFQNADLTLADLRDANIAGADFRGAIFVTFQQNQTEQFIQTPTFGTQSARIEGVDFSTARNLDTKQLAYICSQGGRHPRCP